MDQAQVIAPPRPRPPALNLVVTIRLATFVIALVAWEALSRSGLVYGGVVPSLVAIAQAFVAMLLTPETYRHLAVTGWEVAVGFAIAAVAGVAFGLVAGSRRFFGAATDPYVDGFATAPKTVFLPILMLLFGIDMESKIALGALAGFFPIAINTAAGVRQLNPVYARVGHSFGLSRWQMATKIILPALEGWMITGMRLGLGVTIVGVLLAEIKLSNRGLGFLANNHYNNFRIAQLYALLIAIFALAALLNGALGAAPGARRAIMRRL
jgi:ABC-type nitrate/sulfonate/bicarbonate transport system permease component